MGGTRKLLLVEKISEVVSIEWGDSKESIGNVGDYLLQKLHQLLHILPHIWSLFVEKIRQITPETVHHWVHVGLTVVLPIAMSLLFLYLCFKCCCCCCSRGGLGKMMKAPGRGGRIMPRTSFESNPRGYFVNLRASKPLVY